jgi:hypothetical protein
MGFVKRNQLQARFNVPVNVQGIQDVVEPVTEDDADDLLVPDQVPVPFAHRPDFFDTEHEPSGSLSGFDFFHQVIDSGIQRRYIGPGGQVQALKNFFHGLFHALVHFLPGIFVPVLALLQKFLGFGLAHLGGFGQFFGQFLDFGPGAQGHAHAGEQTFLDIFKHANLLFM